ncbi:hypothetical protein GHT06_021032 [Daphnia sinensis]|uniref:Cytochrome P450 n=1 Tax=Daphnia sinensis TaxID=1820382 RepID=A0AAD5PQG1_9CRUS|nr:hypothetical protein GHT06_021032 [Daphnia sinensis]
MILEVCLTLLLIGLIIKATKRPSNFPPGPKGLPLVGYLPFLSSWDPQYPHKAMKKMSEVYGPVVGFFMGPSQIVISVCGHEAVKEALLNEDLNGRPYFAIAVARSFGEQLGVVFVTGQFWQEQRRFIMRHLRDLGFGKTSIEDQMMGELGDLIKDIENKCQSNLKRIVDFKGIFQVSVINILWAIIAGERFQRNDPKFQQLLTANELIFRAGNIVRGSIPIPALVLKHFRFVREFIGIKTELIEPIHKFIQGTIEDHQHRNLAEEDADNFIDVYLKEMNKQKADNPSTNFTNKQLISTITDLFSAGSESTSGSIGFAIIHLIRDQEAQHKMQMELDQVCGEYFPTLNHRSSLPYTEAVLMEAQRCSSIAPLTVPHFAVKATTIQGYTIPKDSVVMLNLDAVFTDSKYWDNPEVFRPERHLNEDGTKVIKSDHFYPFGLGKRMCLGDSLAKNTYFLFTAALIKKFRFESVPNEPLPSLDPTNGFTLGYQGFKAVNIKYYESKVLRLAMASIFSCNKLVPFYTMKKMSKVYGPVVGFFMGPSQTIISVCSHEAIKEALLNEDLNGRPYSAVALARAFGEKLGIMFVTGQFWQEQRRFTMRHLRDLGFGKTSIEDQMMGELGDLIKDIEIKSERFQRNDPKFQQLLTANELIFRAGNIVRGSIPIPALVLKHFRFVRDFIGLKTELIEPIQKFIQGTIEDHQHRNLTEEDADNFIDVYLKEMNKQNADNPSTNFTNKQLISTITDLFSAGAESTSGSIGFAIIHLVRDQEVQHKMQMELDQVCGEFFPTLNHRSSLPYTEAVLMEAQRCSSIAPLTVPHYAVKATTIQGYTIPKDSVVMLNLDAVFKDPKYWDNPEIFRPERHLNEDGTKVIKNDHFYPFGLGKRFCLGESLAKNTYFLFTAALIKKFRFEPVPNEPLPSLEPINGFTLGYQGFKAVVTPRSSMIFELCLTVVLIGLIIKVTQRPKNFPPGPRGLPLVGYLPFYPSWDPQYPHKGMKKMSDVYGPVVGTYMGPTQPIISVCSHEAIKEAMLNDDLNGRPELAIMTARTFGEKLGIMFATGQFWQEQRRFTLRHLRDLGFGKTSIEDQMMAEVGDLIKDIENKSQSDPGRTVDFKGIFQVSVINILWAIIAGERFQRHDPKFQELLNANELFFRTGKIFRGVVPIPGSLLKRFRFLREFIGIKDELIEPIQKFIQNTIEEHQLQNLSEDDEAGDFIDVYLKEMNKQKAENPSTNFTEKQLISTITDLFGAGSESTSGSIGFAIIHLTRDQQVQQKMQMELDQVCGEFFPTLNHRSSLPYTEAVLMEAQRCSTIAPLTPPHYAIKDTKLQGYSIPKGSLISLNLYAVFQDSKYWKDPEIFRPERHLNDDGTKVIKSDHFNPFGLGKRMCLGESLAKNTYFLFTAALIKKFRFEPVPNEPLPSLDPTNGFTLGYQGFKAVVTPRS